MFLPGIGCVPPKSLAAVAPLHPEPPSLVFVSLGGPPSSHSPPPSKAVVQPSPAPLKAAFGRGPSVLMPPMRKLPTFHRPSHHRALSNPPSTHTTTPTGSPPSVSTSAKSEPLPAPPSAILPSPVKLLAHPFQLGGEGGEEGVHPSTLFKNTTPSSLPLPPSPPPPPPIPPPVEEAALAAALQKAAVLEARCALLEIRVGKAEEGAKEAHALTLSIRATLGDEFSATLAATRLHHKADLLNAQVRAMAEEGERRVAAEVAWGKAGAATLGRALAEAGGVWEGRVREEGVRTRCAEEVGREAMKGVEEARAKVEAALTESRKCAAQLAVDVSTGESMLLGVRKELAVMRVAQGKGEEERQELLGRLSAMEEKKGGEEGGCERCRHLASPLPPPPPPNTPPTIWLAGGEVQALLTKCAALKLCVVAPSVHINVKGAGGGSGSGSGSGSGGSNCSPPSPPLPPPTLTSFPPLLPFAPLAALRTVLQRDVLPLYAAVFTEPRSLRGVGTEVGEWLQGPLVEGGKGGAQAWLAALTKALESDVGEALAGSGSFEAPT